LLLVIADRAMTPSGRPRNPVAETLRYNLFIQAK
jgi:hypothetical protein